jgi:hypothetical protein
MLRICLYLSMIYSETFPKKNQQTQSFSTIISAVYLCCSLILLQCPLLANRHPQDGTIAPLAVLLPPRYRLTRRYHPTLAWKWGWFSVGQK